MSDFNMKLDIDTDYEGAKSFHGNQPTEASSVQKPQKSE